MSLFTDSSHTPLRNAPRSEAPKDFVESFLAGMPESYQSQYGDAEKRQHAQIAWRRGSAIAHVETCHSALEGSWICVVTDDSRGLLSKLSAAISAYSLDILGAKTFCRVREGAKPEALAFFSVRPLRGPSKFEKLEQTEIDAICGGIVSLLEGEIDLASLKRRGWPTERPGESPAWDTEDMGPTAAAYDPVLEVLKRDIDFTLVERNLKLSTEERAQQLVNATRFIGRFRPLVSPPGS